MKVLVGSTTFSKALFFFSNLREHYIKNLDFYSKLKNPDPIEFVDDTFNVVNDEPRIFNKKGMLISFYTWHVKNIGKRARVNIYHKFTKSTSKTSETFIYLF